MASGGGAFFCAHDPCCMAQRYGVSFIPTAERYGVSAQITRLWGGPGQLFRRGPARFPGSGLLFGVPRRRLVLFVFIVDCRVRSGTGYINFALQETSCRRCYQIPAALVPSLALKRKANRNPTSLGLISSGNRNMRHESGQAYAFKGKPKMGTELSHKTNLYLGRSPLSMRLETAWGCPLHFDVLLKQAIS